MAFPPPSPDQITWGAALVLPLATAFLLPVRAPASARRRRWLSAMQGVGGVLILVGLLTSVLMFPVVLLLLFCAIFSGLLQILTFFTQGFPCPAFPPVEAGPVLVQLGVALLLFATVWKWRLAR